MWEQEPNLLLSNIPVCRVHIPVYAIHIPVYAIHIPVCTIQYSYSGVEHGNIKRDSRAGNLYSRVLHIPVFNTGRFPCSDLKVFHDGTTTKTQPSVGWTQAPNTKDTYNHQDTALQRLLGLRPLTHRISASALCTYAVRAFLLFLCACMQQASFYFCVCAQVLCARYYRRDGDIYHK
jgi:hypothetical protein